MKKSQKQQSQFYEFESILKKKKSGNKSLYLIKWKGYPNEQSTWQPEINLKNIQFYIDLFNNSLKKTKIITKKPKCVPQTNIIKQEEEQESSFTVSHKKPKVDLSLQNRRTDIKLRKRVVVRDQSKYFYDQISKSRSQSQKIKQKTSLQCQKIEVKHKYLNSRKQIVFSISSDSHQFQMTQKEVKILFPTELSIFYEKEVMQILQEHQRQHMII